MDRSPFGHFCIAGPQGSGKMSLFNLTNELFKKRHNIEAGIIVVTLEATFDSKNLVGTYVCNESGDFQFKKGPLTVAAEQGMWLVLRNIEETPSDLLSFLLPLIQENILHVTSSMVIRPKLGFRLCFLQQTGVDELHQPADIKPLIDLLFMTQIDSLTSKREDFNQILKSKYPCLFIEVDDKGLTISDLIINSIKYLGDQIQQLKHYLLDFRPATVVQLFSVFKRVNSHFIHFNQIQISQLQRQLIIQEIADVYLGYMYDTTLRQKLIHQLVLTQFNTVFESILDADAVSEYCTRQNRDFGLSNDSCFFGRVSLNRQPLQIKDQNFVYTSLTLRLLEQIAMSAQMNEAVLLVGETGTGKTTAVQEIARVLGKQMHVFNLNQNTDSADLLGGFKPVDIKYLLKPVYERFLVLFDGLFQRTPNNQKFLDLTQKCYESSKVKEFTTCLIHGMTSIKQKRDILLQESILQLEKQIKDLQRRTKKLELQGGFVFQFVEGTLIKSMQNGDWVLLDEINLATESILNRLATIIQGNHVMLNERADIIEMKIHPDFRLFMCMNPPYSSAGKKQLPTALRVKLSEIYVPEIENESDLWQIIDSYTKASQQSTLNEENKRTILMFYIQVKLLISKQTKRGNIGLRNLCRALRFINAAIKLKYPVLKAIYDSLFACFASHLDSQMQDMVKQLIFTLFKIKIIPKLHIPLQRDERFAYIQDSLILLGNHKPGTFDEKEFIITPTFELLLQQLTSIISVSDFAIILEGPTSAGKTSCIQYLAKITHNHVIRINNHMHTDVQEYLGSYVPDAITGKLSFQEGILVEAVRKGYWVILDELNLAPSEVLEALNRLLDDNRELHIVETQKVIKAHSQFRIFATQNPTEGYGGRKELSEAFKNRFVMIKVRDVPTEELKQILEQKCNLPSSRAGLMIKVMESLQIYRSQASVFSGKDSTITVRDLLKWAGRINQNSHLGSHVELNQIALEGFLVLAERSRNQNDKLYIQMTIEKVFGVKLNLENFYEIFFNQNLLEVFQSVPIELNLPPIILTKQLKRLAVLLYKCLQNKEPVLLVGETGCGKTTICQVFAHSVTQQKLFAINCHQNTDTSDFIGCMRTRKTLGQLERQLASFLDTIQLSDEQQQHAQQLSLKKRAQYVHQITQNQQIQLLIEDLTCVFEWTDGILVNAMKEGGLLLIDEISLANDSVLERLNSVFEYDRTLIISEKSAAEAVRIVADQKFNIVATMNPGTDFGKKELSPALRNRMTEIWVESYFMQPELIEVYNSTIVKEVPETIDLKLIISSLCKIQIFDYQEQVSNGIFNIICFLNFRLSERYFSLQRKSLSIRDILNIIEFIKISCQASKFTTNKLDIQTAFKNAIELVIIDGLCLGIDSAGESEKQNIVKDSYDYLNLILSTFFSAQQQQQEEFINTIAHIGVSPFLMPRKSSVYSEFAFDAQTTKNNLKKLLRAFSLGKPVLIEGSPGVGKTSLVENLARQTGKKLIRVNLSDQTDMMDLLGSEYPVTNQDEDIQFSWCDGVLLQAIKEGHWFLIDEMNLAQQSILEGLNAILDHRRTVYIPELNQEFVCHPDFFLFACQNPSQSSGQTSGRKTLPKSFLNRFSKIYLEDLLELDYRVILNHQASDVFISSQVDNLLEITKALVKPLEKQTVNMRDLSRFLKLYRHLRQQVQSNSAIAIALETCYGRPSIQLAIDFGLLQKDTQIPITSLVRTTEEYVKFEGLHLTTLKQGKEDELTSFEFKDYQDLKGKHAKQIQQLCDCLHSNLPVLVVTNDSQRFSKTLRVLARLSKQKLRRILLNDRSDTTQLLGCFEQTSNNLSQILANIYQFKSTPSLTAQITKLQYEMQWCTQDEQRHKIVETFLTQNKFEYLQQKLQKTQAEISRFEWVDSVLVQAVQQGQWAVIENANLCNPSILDRLNGLFEEGSQSLAINEQGLVQNKLREVIKHENFRVIFVITAKTLKDQGKDVSKALRNRCLEIDLEYEEPQMSEFDLFDEFKISGLKTNSELVYFQKQHDLLPTFTQVQKPIASLGKRNNPEMTEVNSLRQVQRPTIAEYIKIEYPFYLPLLEKSDLNPFEEYLRSEIEKFKQIVVEKIKIQILENSTKKQLMQLVQNNVVSVDLYILFSQLLQKKQLREVNEDNFLIYQQTKCSDIQLTVSPDFYFILEPVDFELLSHVSRPNTQVFNFLKNWIDTVPQSIQEIFVYKLPTQKMFSKRFESRYSTILRLLSFNGATIILINAEKEITVETDKIIQHLEETCFDVGAVLHTPNLLIVPSNLQENVIVLSQSHLHNTLAYIKDYLKLQTGNIGKNNHFRLTKIPAILRSENLDLNMKIIICQLTLQVINGLYSSESYQLNLIKAVLIDEKTIAIKDLPSAYAASHSLLYKLQKLAKDESPQNIQFYELANQILQKEGESLIVRAFGHLKQLRTSEIIKAMFILPLEAKRRAQSIQLNQQDIECERFFWEYHLKDNLQPEYLLANKQNQVQQLVQELSKLNSLGQDGYTQTSLRQTLQFIEVLTQELTKIEQGNTNQIDSLAQLIYGQIDTLHFANVSNILSEMMLCVVTIITQYKQILKTKQLPAQINTIVGLQFQDQFFVSMFKAAKNLSKQKNELCLKWILKLIRLNKTPNQKIQSAILEHFIQREVIKRMLLEEASVVKFSLPFQMREQDIQAPLGKAMDEWTKADKAKMDADAEKEIALNFPSYFDEVQKAYYSGEFTKDVSQIVQEEEVPLQDILQELLEITPCDEYVYRSDFLTDRLKIIEATLTDQQIEGYTEWVDDIEAYISHSLKEQKLKQVMNISDVILANSYNFYHSPLPQECKLVYQPLIQLQMRLRDIMVIDKYESPLLNESLFLANYMLACFNIEVTPLMKILTCMEFLLQKLEEWENTYASKRLNSVENEVNTIKLLIIRYRKIQILSWRNLLNWKKDKLIKEDFENSIRLAHTITKQVFEGSEEIIKILDLCDLYIRDSTLATYKPRLQFILLFKEHLITKQFNSKKTIRLKQAINALDFIYIYYCQFKPKLDQTIARLDQTAREKIKTLIDIKKWTLQKFSIMKGNVDKTHRQLNKACKGEEEVLIQNVQSLVLESSRKKFGGQNDQLLSLDIENKKINLQIPKFDSQNFIVKQLQFLEQNKLMPNWPSSLSLQESIDVLMERMQEVRATNKKYLQKKAFYDLLKFMKDEGLRSNFQIDFQPMLLQTQSESGYFMKAYETYVMLKGSTQSEEVTDLKSVDVLRCQGFSQHLMYRCLELTKLKQNLLQSSNLNFMTNSSQQDYGIQFSLSEENCKKLKKVLQKLQLCIISLHEQFSTQFQLQNLNNKEQFGVLIQILKNSSSELPLVIIYQNQSSQILKIVSDIKAALIMQNLSLREQNLQKSALQKIDEFEIKLTEFIQTNTLVNPIVLKREKKLENQVKLFYQDLIKLVDKKVLGQDQSMDNNSTTAGVKALDQQPILTIDEKLQFYLNLQDVFEKHIPTINQTGQQIINLKGVNDCQSVEVIQNSVFLLLKVQNSVQQIMIQLQTYLDSMAKFSYLSQRVFLYLIYQGFCGQEEEDDPDVEPPSDVEKDGMGMGEGKGDDNVADQIEHEEQLEGLKDYQSDDEQKQEQEEQQEGNDEEENDFEMKEDFDGNMDSDSKSQNSNNKSSDEDDENDQVDDMLDNNLWNQNMQDMEEQEEKDKQEENREQDLGERDLQNENIMDQLSDMAEGDHEKDEKEQKEAKEQNSDQEMASDDEQQDEGERQSSEEDNQDIGLNNDSAPAEPDESFSQSSQSAEEEEEVNKQEQSDQVSEVDSQYDEKNQEEISDDQEDISDQGVKNDFNQNVLEDEQIQANEQNKDKNDQANLKKQQDNKVESSNNNDQKPDQVDSQQVDANGQDLLFNFAQQLQQKQQQKQSTEDQKQADKKQAPKNQIQDPNMVDKKEHAQQEIEDNLADEYMFDEMAQQTEGKLATEKVQDQNHVDDEVMAEQQGEGQKQQLNPEQQDIEMTQTEFKNNAKNQNIQQKNEEQIEVNDFEMKETETRYEDLIQMYNDYLNQKVQAFDMTQEDDREQNNSIGTKILQTLDSFDYFAQKQLIAKMFQQWQSDPELHEQSLQLLAKFKNNTQQVTSSLCEQLRIVLEPQLSQNLQGDFKTGKRLNMKKVISFIASNYRNDKIWLRRTLPSKRDYKILIAIDDTLSMKESNLGFFSLEASVALGEALNRLEVGKVAVARIRDRLDLIQSFEDNYNHERAAHIISQFEFKHCGKTSADTAMANFVQDANKLLDIYNGKGQAVNCPFVIVLSDGRFNKENVRRFMREAKEKKYLFLFVVLDQKKQANQSILQMKSALKQANGSVKLESYMKDFPFDYYCVISDTSQLPSALGTILVQWFSMIAHN